MLNRKCQCLITRAKATLIAESLKPLLIPFDLPVNYTQNVTEGLKKQLLNGNAFAKFLLSITSGTLPT